MPDEPIADVVSEGPPGEEEIEPTFDLSIFIEQQGILCEFRCDGRNQQWTVPKTVVRRPHKAMSIDHVFDLLARVRSSDTCSAKR